MVILEIYNLAIIEVNQILRGIETSGNILNKHVKFQPYEVENSYITTKTLIPYFDVSISSRDLHQKKMVLSSSES